MEPFELHPGKGATRRKLYDMRRILVRSVTVRKSDLARMNLRGGKIVPMSDA